MISKDITGQKEIWKLAVKVDDFWTNMKSGKKFAEIIVRDLKVFKSFLLILSTTFLRNIRRHHNIKMISFDRVILYML
jgi:hypothetical protein